MIAYDLEPAFNVGSVWDPAAALHFDRTAGRVSQPITHTEGASDDLDPFEIADYRVREPEHISAAGWTLSDWIRAEHKPRHPDTYRMEDMQMSENNKTTTTVEALLVASAEGQTTSGKPKRVAVFTPHNEAAGIDRTPAGTIKAQTSDPVAMAMLENIGNAVEVTAEISTDETLSDTGEIIRWNTIHLVTAAE